MKTPLSKIEKAVAVKDGRYYLNDVYLDVEKSRLVSTNGHICAIVPIETDEGDTSGPVSVEALKHARKLKSEHIKVNGSLALDNGMVLPRPEKANYPDVDRIIPKEDGFKVIIGLDASLLLKLAEAVNDQSSSYLTNLKLHISGPNEAIKVTGNIKGAIGVIMPVRI